MRSSRLCRRRRVATGAPRVQRVEDDDDKSVKPSRHNPHVETATGPADEQEVFRGEDALQDDLPYAAVPSEDGDKRDDGDCY